MAAQYCCHPFPFHNNNKSLMNSIMNSITKISKRMTRIGLLLMLFVAQSLASSAQVKLYMEDVIIPNGGSKVVSLMLDNDKEATALQVTIDMPNGLYIWGVDKTNRIKGRGASVQYDQKSSSATTTSTNIVMVDGTIAPGTGAVITFSIYADASILAEGEHVITLHDIIISDANANQIATTDETTAKLYHNGLDDCKMSAANPEIGIAEGAEQQIDILLDNPNIYNISALSGKFTLPEGLEIVEGEYGKFDYTDRTPSPLEFKFKEYEGYTTFVLSSSTNRTINGTSGTIFSFKVKANSPIAENSEIVLSELRIANTAGRSALLEDVVIKVSDATTYNVTATVATAETGTVEGAGIVARNAEITLTATPAEGYQFVNWTVGEEEVATTAEYTFVPTADIDLVANFKPLQFVVKFMLDDEVISEETLDYGAAITTPANPEKEGNTFTGWTPELYETMPAQDVTYTATFSVNSYTIRFVANGAIVDIVTLPYGSPITVPEAPAKEGYTFAGWGADETVPAKDVTYTATYTVNSYKVRYYVDNTLLSEQEVEFGAELKLIDYTPEDPERFTFMGWIGVTYDTMPAHDVEYHANIVDGIKAITTNGSVEVYTLDGKRTNIQNLKKGVYIINGKKVLVK